MAPILALAGFALIVVAMVAYCAVAAGGDDPVLRDGDDHRNEGVTTGRFGGSGEHKGRGQC